MRKKMSRETIDNCCNQRAVEPQTVMAPIILQDAAITGTAVMASGNGRSTHLSQVDRGMAKRFCETATVPALLIAAGCNGTSSLLQRPLDIATGSVRVLRQVDTATPRAGQGCIAD
jgi:hypothetical protein